MFGFKRKKGIKPKVVKVLVPSCDIGVCYEEHYTTEVNGKVTEEGKVLVTCVDIKDSASVMQFEFNGETRQFTESRVELSTNG